MNRPTESYLGELVYITGGGTPRRDVAEYWNGDIPWVTVKDFTTKLIISAQERITQSGLKNSASNLIPERSILIPTRMALGKVAINEVPVAINQDIKALQIIDKEKVDLKYLALYLSTISKVIENAGKGATVKGVKLEFVKSIKVPLPALDDQIRIATVLARVEKLIAKRKRSVLALDELLKSIFFDMFGDPVTNEKGWDEASLISGCKNKNDIKCGPFGTQLSKSEYQKYGIPLWGIPQINSYFKINPVDFLTPEKALELEDYSIEFGDIVMSRKGNVGKCALYPVGLPKGIMHSDVLRIRVSNDKLNPVFLCYQLRISNKVKKQIDGLSKGAIMAGINVGKLKSIQILFPPINLQKQYAGIVEKVESLKMKCVNGLNELENLYGSLSQRAFNGTLDLSKIPIERRTDKYVTEIEAMKGDDLNMIQKREFRESDLIEQIRKYSGKVFSFEELWKELSASADFTVPTRHELQKRIIETLDSDSKVLEQVFDYLSSDIEEESKELRIAFKGNL